MEKGQGHHELELDRWEGYASRQEWHYKNGCQRTAGG